MQETDSTEKKPIVISIANQKGGVGKTTTAVNVGAGLAIRGYKVLVLDLDIQANATHILHRPLQEDEPNLAEALLEDVTLDELILETSTPGLHIACSGETMVRVDLALSGMLGREETLKRVLQESEKATSMDFIIIDTSPYLGLLTVNALVATDYVVIPVSCEYLPMLGLKLFLSTIRTVQKRLNGNLEVLGYLLTMYDRRENITFDVERIMRKQFGELVFPRPIRINTRHKASPAHRQTIFQYEGKSGKGIEDYTRLTTQILKRIGIGDDENEPTQDDPTNEEHTNPDTPTNTPTETTEATETNTPQIQEANQNTTTEQVSSAPSDDKIGSPEPNENT
jgi:chromosome partitioning protein